MDKRKRSNEEIYEMSLKYANGGDKITEKTLSKEYGISTTTVSKYLHFAIEQCRVPEKVAIKIKQKAVSHDYERRRSNGWAITNEVAEIYNTLIFRHREKMDEVLNYLDLKYSELKFHFDSLTDTMASSDEYTDDEDSLIRQMKEISEKIKIIKSLDYLTEDI